MSDKIDEKRGVQVLRAIADSVRDTLTRQGLPAELAERSGLDAAEGVRETFGGEQVYISTGYALAISQRDREIYRLFNGNNHRQLSKKFQVTERAIYHIIARVRQAEMDERQDTLW